MKSAWFVWLFVGSRLLVGAENSALVTVQTVTRSAAAETISLSGGVTAERRASLSARTTGLVRSVSVDAGSKVERGDVVLELDSALAELALERATEAVVEAKAQLTETRRLYDEGRKLAASGGLPRTESDARSAALRVQMSAFSQLEIDRRERAEIVARHQLVAPFSGVIGEKMTEVGEWVETGVPVLELVEVDAVRFDVRAPQELYPVIDEATPVTLRLDSKPDVEIPARVIARVPVKDVVARTFLVRVEAETPHPAMLPGVSGRATFQIAGGGDALTVPRDAIVRRPDGSTLAWVVEQTDGTERVTERAVTIGDRMAETVIVLDGLEEGERVVVRGNESLESGQEVTVLEGESTATPTEQGP